MSRTIVFATPIALAQVALLLFAGGAAAEPDERVTVHTSYGFLKDDNWIIPLRLWVHEEPDILPRVAADAIKDRLMATAGLESLSFEQEALFHERSFGFIADNESDEFPLLRFTDDPQQRTYQLPVDADERGTDGNGLSEGLLTIPVSAVGELLAAQESDDGWLDLEVVSDGHAGSGSVRLINAQGLSVISDIDDTIKVTDILGGHGPVIYNTFFRTFEAAPCMPALYQSLGSEVPVHYVSGGPWQLYQPISDFITSDESGYPNGSFHMKNVRTNLFESETYEDLSNLLGGSDEMTFNQKLEQIATLLRRFPDRRFLLVGDSGERDPEIFGEIRRQHPQQIADIWIRDVANDDSANPDRLRGMRIIPSQVVDPAECDALLSRLQLGQQAQATTL